MRVEVPLDSHRLEGCDPGKMENRMYSSTVQAAATVVLVTMASLTAQTGRADSAFAGVGSASCSQYAELVRLDPQRTHDMFLTWAQGFMSGLNAPQLDERLYVELLPARYPAPAQTRFLSAYCARHPRASFFDAVRALWNELQASTLESRTR